VVSVDGELMAFLFRVDVQEPVTIAAPKMVASVLFVTKTLPNVFKSLLKDNKHLLFLFQNLSIFKDPFDNDPSVLSVGKTNG
jgi:hypothetical protein